MRYSETVLDHFGNPRNVGPPKSHTHAGTAGKTTGGPFMVVYLQVEGNVIKGAWYQTYGCAAAIAAGSRMTELVTGMGISEARAFSQENLVEALDGLPLGKLHCAGIAVSALRAATRHTKDEHPADPSAGVP